MKKQEYSLKEVILNTSILGLLVRFAVGPSKKYKGIVKNVKSPHNLNNDLKPIMKITFIGDILDIQNKNLIIDKTVKEYIKDSNYLIGNFEGTITKIKGIPLVTQRHKHQIIETLCDLFPPEKTYLSLSNNHAGDFGEKEFFNSKDILESKGFNVFGWNDKPFIDIKENLRIISGTEMTNKKCKYVFGLEDSEKFLKNGSFNLLYPHWGFEQFLYPIPQTVELGKKFIKKFDAIVGHHSHCPQPVTIEKISDKKKLIAYSLGDFCFGLKFKKFQYGLILKIEFGIDKKNNIKIAKMEHKTIRSQVKTNEVTVKIADLPKNMIF